MKTPSRLVLIASALVSSSAMALPSPSTLFAGSATRTETVKYKASEASTVEGASALYAKLQDAAKRVCTEDAGFAFDFSGLDACVVDAVDTAVRRVSIPMVTVMHLQARQTATVAAR